MSAVEYERLKDTESDCAELSERQPKKAAQQANKKATEEGTKKAAKKASKKGAMRLTGGLRASHPQTRARKQPLKQDRLCREFGPNLGENAFPPQLEVASFSVRYLKFTCC